MASTPPAAGGRATYAGTNFQTGVSAWFAAHLLSKDAIGSRFGQDGKAVPQRLQFETGRNLDDIEVQLSDGSLISVQCKTSLTLSAGPQSPFSTVVAQLINLHKTTTTTGERASGILAVSPSAPGSLDDLNRACRMFDAGATWEEVTARANAGERAALEVLREHAMRAWPTSPNASSSETALAELARLLHVVRFDVNPGGADWREASKALQTGLYGSAKVGESALVQLQFIAQDLIRKGVPSDRDGWLRSLRKVGFEDRHAPGFDSDIAQLVKWTQSELGRLKRHASLANGSQIFRECIPDLGDSVKDGSLLVVGDPGAGKTGTLVMLARELQSKRAPMVFLSVDDLAAVTDSAALSNALGIGNDFLEVLGAWPGTASGVLIIDALDASRGGASEAVFARTIERVIGELGERWSVVASIRTFDLRHGKRLRALMQGTPPSELHVEKDLDDVRHFAIQQLTDTELVLVGESNRDLGRLISAAPPAIRQLLRNVFNLSLAAELVHKGLAPEAIQAVTSQSQLISRYEDERLPTHRLKRAVAQVVAEMARQERLVVRQDRIANDALEDVIASGVLVSVPQDRLSFAHHVLFDHAVGRFYLDLDEAAALTAQVAGQPAIGLLLGPGLRFALMDRWESGATGKSEAWLLATGLASHKEMDPVLGSIALRTVIENVCAPADVQQLIDLLRNERHRKETGQVLSRASRFFRVGLPTSGSVHEQVVLAWTAVASTAAGTGATEHIDGSRILLLTLMDCGDFEQPEFLKIFGSAARSLLSTVWSKDLFGLSSSAIRFVTRAFESDPKASRKLLEQAISDPHFSKHATQEAPWLAEGVPYMVHSDPDFVERIYATLFGRESPQEGATWLGGGPSRIMPLRSTHEQDYKHARWQLEEALPTFLRAAPEHGTRAVSSCAIGQSIGERSGQTQVTRVSVPGASFVIADDSYSLEEWRDEDSGAHLGSKGRILKVFTDFLRTCSDEDFQQCAQAALTATVSSSVLSRLFGIATERPGITDELLWPVATFEAVLINPRVNRDAITFIASAMPRRCDEQRAAFEQMLLERIHSTDDDATDHWKYRAQRFLSLVEPDQLLSPELARYQAELKDRGELTGNEAYVRSSVGRYFGDDDVVEALLRRHGVDTKSGSDMEIMLHVRPLERHLKAVTEPIDADGIATTWGYMEAVISSIDDQALGSIKDETLHAAWGYVSNGAARIAEAEAFSPTTAVRPALGALLALLDRLAESPFPAAPSGDSSGMMGWGNWDVRVYAAQSHMALSRRNWDVGFEPRLRRALLDPAPTVRHQVSCALNTLWEIARPTMWELMEFVAENETHAGVLAFFVAGPIRRIAGADPVRCAQLVTKILPIVEIELTREEKHRGELAEAVASVAAHLWLGRGDATAKQWIDQWIANLEAFRPLLVHLISQLRGPLFFKWSGKVEVDHAAEIQARSRDLLAAIVDSELAALQVAKSILKQDGNSDAGIELYRKAAQQLEHAVNQLYFGSGAAAAAHDNAGGVLSDRGEKQEFIAEYGAVLQEIGDTGISSIVYHLVELYEFLADASPELVFDRIAVMLLGPAAVDGFQFESLAETALVRLVQTYLADYRSVFAKHARREQLVKVLELFSTAGAPEALRLLYELPDLLR
jgi:hypothetical protein